ncbi:MAG TPA: hypothetical protein DCX07_13045 [Phycisphaerales bacterium]|nr:hypothetical protein [Phycisphaerales bacterium]
MDVKLVMFKSTGQRKDFPLTRDATVIGRGENCDLQIPLLAVSRRHCELVLDGESVAVKDLASSNGTYVNNRRVNEQKLQAGDRLVVGPVVFTIQVNGEPEEIQPIKTRGQKLAEAGKGGRETALGVDAEVTSHPGASETDMAEAAVEGVAASEEELDPIAALEALAGKADEEEKKKKE